VTSPEAVRAVIEQWRKEAVVIDAQANSNQQFSVRTMELLDVEASIRRQCADELEAALTAPELELECEIHPMMRKADCPCGAVSEVPEQAKGWQPIETAPKDGTNLLLCEARNGEIGNIEHGAWEFIERSDWDGAKVYGWCTDFGRIDEPTHWMMPLPAPPPAEEPR
jgi:hypothetical protein